MRWLLWMVVAGSACKKQQPADLSEFVMKFIADARGDGIPADAVDEERTVQIHRAQKVKLAGKGGAPAEMLTKFWHDETETHGSPDARSQKQRERAQQALKRTLKGECRAEVDEVGAKLRVGAITDPPPTASEEVKNGLERMRKDLESARVVRVTCAEGNLGLMALPSGGSWKVVDLFQIGTGPKIDLKPDGKAEPKATE
jgi:hypothetical protein